MQKHKIDINKYDLYCLMLRIEVDLARTFLFLRHEAAEFEIVKNSAPHWLQISHNSIQGKGHRSNNA